MPLDNWIGLHDNSDYTKLSRTGNICKRAGIAFDELESSFVDIFGVTKEFKELQSKRIELEIMKCRQLYTNDLSTQVFIELLEEEIDKLKQGNTKGQKLMKVVLWVEHEMGGMAIDATKTTVFDFYNRVNFIVEKNKK